MKSVGLTWSPLGKKLLLAPVWPPIVCIPSHTAAGCRGCVFSVGGDVLYMLQQRRSKGTRNYFEWKLPFSSVTVTQFGNLDEVTRTLESVHKRSKDARPNQRIGKCKLINIWRYHFTHIEEFS